MSIEDWWNDANRIRLERENSPNANWSTMHPTWNTILRSVVGSDSPGNVS